MGFLDSGTGSENGSDQDPFERNERDRSGKLDALAQAVRWLVEELDLPLTVPKTLSLSCSSSETLLLPFQSTPVFLAPGIEDEQVWVELGRQARDCLRSLGAQIEWRSM